MQPDSRKLLADIRDATVAIAAFVKGRALIDLAHDDLLRSGIYWKFTVIGEAISQLRRVDEPTFDAITEGWKIVGFRNQIIHGYASIEDAITWDIIQEKLPVLLAEVEALLA
jgi:uncharacterized protein with HEPN domain